MDKNLEICIRNEFKNEISTFSEKYDKLNFKIEKKIPFILNIIDNCHIGNRIHRKFRNKDVFWIHDHDDFRNIHRTEGWKILKTFFKPYSLGYSNLEKYPYTNAYCFSEKLDRVIVNYYVKTAKENKMELNNKIEINKSNTEKLLDFLVVCRYNEDNGLKLYNDTLKPKEDLKELFQISSRIRDVASILINSNDDIYEEASTGRFFMKNKNNLQMLYSEIRKVILSGLGNYDYDFENCHYAILYQILQQNKFDLASVPVFCEYINNKATFRDKLVKELNITKQQVKEVLISLINDGAKNKFAECFQFIDYRNIIANDTFTILRNEMSLIIKFIHRISINNNIVVNVLGKVLDLSQKEEGKKRNTQKRKIMAHVLQGYESLFIRIIEEKYSNHLILKIFDGFIMNKDILETDISNLIENKTGFKMSLSKESLSTVHYQGVDE